MTLEQKRGAKKAEKISGELHITARFLPDAQELKTGKAPKTSGPSNDKFNSQDEAAALKVLEKEHAERKKKAEELAQKQKLKVQETDSTKVKAAEEAIPRSCARSHRDCWCKEWKEPNGSGGRRQCASAPHRNHLHALLLNSSL